MQLPKLSPLVNPASAFDELNPGTLTVLYAEDNVVNVELVRQIMHMRPNWHLEGLDDPRSSAGRR